MRKRQRRLDGIDELVLSLTANDLTTGEVSAHLAELYGAQVSKDTISNITDQALAEMADRQNRPLDRIYPVVFIDAAREQDILGLWAGDGGEGAKFWLSVLTEIKNRGALQVGSGPRPGPGGRPSPISTRNPRPGVGLQSVRLPYLW